MKKLMTLIDEKDLGEKKSKVLEVKSDTNLSDASEDISKETLNEKFSLLNENYIDKSNTVGIKHTG